MRTKSTQRPKRRLPLTLTTALAIGTLIIGLTAIPASAATIASFLPASGAPGTSVTITGTGFLGTTAVQFNAVASTFTIDSDTQITASVPCGASDGPITVMNPGGNATSLTNFDVTAAGAPTITSFAPPSGAPGTSVTITGTNLCGATSVSFNGVAAASFTVNSVTQITAQVSCAATDGAITVVTPSGSAMSATNFDVTAAGAPTITSFAPTSGPTGTSVTINGTNFCGATAVRFNGVTSTYTVDSPIKITATVPATATSGLIEAVTPAGTGTSATQFTVNASSADVGIEIVDAPDPVAPGGTIGYTITVTNLGPATVTNLPVTSAVPTGTTFVTADNGGTEASGTVTWTVASLASGASATLTYSVTVDAATTASSVSATASTTVPAPTTDPDTTDNTATADTAIGGVATDLTIAMAADNTKPDKGDVISFAIQVTNAGPADATGVIVTDKLPKGLKYLSSVKAVGDYDPATGVLEVGDLAVDGVATFILNATVTAGNGKITNRATVSAPGVSDPEAGNSADSVTLVLGASGGGGSGSGGGSGGSGSGTGSGGTTGTAAGGGTAYTGSEAARNIPLFLLLLGWGIDALIVAQRLRRQPARNRSF